MKSGNKISSPDFIFLGLLSRTNVHTFPIATILLAIIAALSGNALLILVIQVDSSLHTPMYFFLCQLAFMDICQTLIIVPKMLADFLIPSNPISPAGCGTQIFLMLIMGVSECLLLTVMSYDRYIAICIPLQYIILMSRNICFLLSAGVWMAALVNALIHIEFTLALPYCGSKEIDHFFCEVPALLKLSCSDTSQYEALVFVTGIVLVLIPSSIILLLLYSSIIQACYTCILPTVLSMKSTKGQLKALATCSSHLTVVVMFYGTVIFMYMRPSSFHSPDQDKILALFYTIVPPVLNPLIYSLRNRDVLGALKKLIGIFRVFQQN